MLDHYNLLHVAPGASPDEIRAAFRREAKHSHPDAHPHASAVEREAHQRRFILLAQAYDTLSDPARRAEYDRRRHAQTAQARPRERSRPARPAGKPEQTRSQHETRRPPDAAEPEPDWDDLLRDVEHLLGRFGLNLKQPFEELLDSLLAWAMALFRDVSATATPKRPAAAPKFSAKSAGTQARSAGGHAGSDRARSQSKAHAEAIERELAELKKKAGRKD